MNGDAFRSFGVAGADIKAGIVVALSSSDGKIYPAAPARPVDVPLEKIDPEDRIAYLEEVRKRLLREVEQGKGRLSDWRDAYLAAIKTETKAAGGFGHRFADGTVYTNPHDAFGYLANVAAWSAVSVLGGAVDPCGWTPRGLAEKAALELTNARGAVEVLRKTREELEEKNGNLEARIRGLEEDVTFLAPRAHKDGEWYADENRDFGLSANNLVNVAYGAKDAGNRPYDIWDMRACERAYAKLPAHRMTEEVRLLLVACRAALAPPPEAEKRGEG